MTTATTVNSLFFNADRNAAVRLALGAALAHEETVKLSNREIARRIGCGEGTVRRYRKIATDIGLAGLIRVGSVPVVVAVPPSLKEEIGGTLMSLRDGTEEATSAFGKQTNARATTLIDLLNQNPTKGDLLYIQAATNRMLDEVESPFSELLDM